MAQPLFSRSGVRYEVACDILGSLIAHQSEVIGAERDKPDADERLIAAAEVEQSRLRRLRESLDPSDAAAVEEVIGTYGPQARAAYQ